MAFSPVRFNVGTPQPAEAASWDSVGGPAAVAAQMDDFRGDLVLLKQMVERVEAEAVEGLGRLRGQASSGLTTTQQDLMEMKDKVDKCFAMMNTGLIETIQQANEKFMEQNQELNDIVQFATQGFEAQRVAIDKTYAELQEAQRGVQ